MGRIRVNMEEEMRGQVGELAEWNGLRRLYFAHNPTFLPDADTGAVILLLGAQNDRE
jgi:hypothetical protein